MPLRFGQNSERLQGLSAVLHQQYSTCWSDEEQTITKGDHLTLEATKKIIHSVFMTEFWHRIILSHFYDHFLSVI